MFTDAGSTGFGFFCPGSPVETASDVFSTAQRAKSSAFRELVPVLAALRSNGSSWFGRRVLLFIDNSADVFLLNRGASRSAECNDLLRLIHAAAGEHEIALVAVHVPRHFNRFADAISKFPRAAFSFRRHL